MPTTLKRSDIIYPELSYKIIGVLFDVFNQLGYRYQEKYYQKAISNALAELKIPFKEQVQAPIEFKGQIIGRYFYDFLIDGKIILEIKRGDNFSVSDIKQIVAYLERSKLHLGILARFSSRGLKYKRIVNIKR